MRHSRGTGDWSLAVRKMKRIDESASATQRAAGP